MSFEFAVIRRWNLNEIQRRYARTREVESAIDLRLGLKRKDGKKQPIGRYLLPLDTLADEGFVTRRVVDGHRVFDIQIYRENDNSYFLGVRRHETTPLSRYAIP